MKDFLDEQNKVYEKNAKRRILHNMCIVDDKLVIATERSLIEISLSKLVNPDTDNKRGQSHDDDFIETDRESDDENQQEKQEREKKRESSK